VLDKRGVTLLDAVQASFQEHQYCGELDGGVKGDASGWRVRAERWSIGMRIVTDSRGRVAVVVSVAAFG